MDFFQKSIINLDDKNSKGTHCVSLCIDKNTAIYFDSFGTEYFPLEVLNKMRYKSVTHSISIMCGFYCITCRKNCVGLYQIIFSKGL